METKFQRCIWASRKPPAAAAWGSDCPSQPVFLWDMVPISSCKDWDGGRWFSFLTHSPCSSITLVDMGLCLVLMKKPSPRDLLAPWLPQTHCVLSASWLKVLKGYHLWHSCVPFRSGTHPGSILWGQRARSQVNQTGLLKPVMSSRYMG